MFIDRGVLATYTDTLNQTVLYYAAREGKVNCVDMLLKQGKCVYGNGIGCNVNHRDQYGQTPLYYAAREGHYGLAEKLIVAGADVNNEDGSGQTALFYSAREGRRNICELLIKHGVNINKQDKKKQTALHWAKKFNKIEVMDYLVSCGATPLKESAVEKEKEKEKPSFKKAAGGKKKQPDKNSPKKYVLTLYKDGSWRSLNTEEVKAFIAENKEVGMYLKNPELINSLKLPPVSQTANIFYHWDKAASKIIGHLWKQQGAWHFHQAVDPITFHIPDYLQIIKKPMDFGLIKQKLASGAYSKCQEFVADVEQVFTNCITYNGETSDFGLLAKNLREEFKKQCQLLSLDYYM